MAQVVLQHVALSYQLFWDDQRQLAGVQLRVDPDPLHPLDTAHLLTVLQDVWGKPKLPLLLSTSSDLLRMDLLDQLPAAFALLEVPDDTLQHPTLQPRVLRAHQRRLPMVWRGEPGQGVKAAHAACFTQSILSLTPEQALAALRVARRRKPGLDTGASPVQAKQIYEGVASRALANHCLDDQGISALLGWPSEDVLYACRQKRIACDQPTITHLINAIDSHMAMDGIEHALCNDPLLAYRFLRYTNSAALGLNRDISSLRQGLMVLGLGRLKTWLTEQLPQASVEPNLQPVRRAMVLRAQVTAELLHTGENEALRRELFLCGLLSQIDQLMNEPLSSTLSSLPLPARISTAIVGHSGPYWPYLAIATALENPHAHTLQDLCTTHEFELEDVNLALLRVLAAQRCTMA